MYHKLLLSTVSALTIFSNTAIATENATQMLGGVGLDQTRVIFQNGDIKKEFGIINKMPSSMLVSSWVTDLERNPSEAFVVTPSLFQLRSGATGKGIIQLVSSLPQDRESVFWLVVNTVSAGEAKAQQMKIAVGQRIKVFYRPKGLEGNTSSSASKLKWEYKDGQLTAKNETALSVTVGDIFIGDKRMNVTGMILPFSENSWNINFKPNNCEFSFIDEYGGEVKFPLKIKG